MVSCDQPDSHAALFTPEINRIHSPFTCEGTLPWIFRIYSDGFRSTDTPAGKAVALGCRALYRALRPFHTAKHLCRFTSADGADEKFLIHSGNTQFHALYHPDYRKGYEIDVAVFLERALADAEVFFDIGSNWGYFSLFAASLPNRPSAIHSFEPIPDTFADLSRVVMETGSDDRIEVHNYALSDKDGNVRMEFGDGLHSGVAQIISEDGEFEVRTARLDGMITDLPAPGVCKIDVEGHEAAVLRGAERTIRENRPHLIFESGSMEPLCLLEKDFDYQLFVPVFEFSGDSGSGMMNRYQFDSKWNGSSPFRFGLKPVTAREAGLFSAPNLVGIARDRVAEIGTLLNPS